jgi:hypothetical protein
MDHLAFVRCLLKTFASRLLECNPLVESLYPNKMYGSTSAYKNCDTRPPVLVIGYNIVRITKQMFLWSYPHMICLLTLHTQFAHILGYFKAMMADGHMHPNN